jgi:hypothetical protein
MPDVREAAAARWRIWVHLTAPWEQPQSPDAGDPDGCAAKDSSEWREGEGKKGDGVIELSRDVTCLSEVRQKLTFQ